MESSQSEGSRLLWKKNLLFHENILELGPIEIRDKSGITYTFPSWRSDWQLGISALQFQKCIPGTSLKWEIQ